MNIDTARKADRAPNAGSVLRRKVTAYWRALVAMLPCNRGGSCAMGSGDRLVGRPGRQL